MRHKRRIMVCVTQQKSCERLIEKGAELCRGTHDEIHVVHVVKENWKYFGQLGESDALEYLFDTSKNHSASLSVIKATDIEETLNGYIEKNKINGVVMGESLEPTSQQNMIKRLKKKVTRELEFEVVPLEFELSNTNII